MQLNSIEIVAAALAALCGCTGPGTQPSDLMSAAMADLSVAPAASVSDAAMLHGAGVDLSVAPPVDAGSDAKSTRAAGHHRCGWVMVTDPAGKASFLANAAWFDAIHPDWFALTADGQTLRPILGTDDAQTLAAAKEHDVAVIPLVASVDHVEWTRTMLSTAARRTAHIKELVNIAVSRNYAGLDIDYEHLWDKADGPPLMAFVKEFAAAMHAAGKVASMAVPSLATPSSVWNYDELVAALDQIHLMGYDYHTIGTHAGPTAPLGWIDDVAIAARGTGHPERFLLGVPNYGVTSSSSCVLSQCPTWCKSAIATSSPHMLSCSYGAYSTVERILNCDTSGGPLFFDDTASLEQKVASAKAHGLGGITYWNLGGEPTGFFTMIANYY